MFHLKSKSLRLYFIFVQVIIPSYLFYALVEESKILIQDSFDVVPLTVLSTIAGGLWFAICWDFFNKMTRGVRNVDIIVFVCRTNGVLVILSILVRNYLHAWYFNDLRTFESIEQRLSQFSIWIAILMCLLIASVHWRYRHRDKDNIPDYARWLHTDKYIRRNPK